MALKFMVIGLPRSATTWAANWLSTDDCLVAHDPLYYRHFNDWGNRFKAVSCTGVWRWPEWVNNQGCPKIVLRRLQDEVEASLVNMDLSGALEPLASDTISRIDGFHVYYTGLFEERTAERIWAICHPDKPFDVDRWRELKRIRMEPNLGEIKPDPAASRKLLAELRALDT